MNAIRRSTGSSPNSASRFDHHAHPTGTHDSANGDRVHNAVASPVDY